MPRFVTAWPPELFSEWGCEARRQNLMVEARVKIREGAEIGVARALPKREGEG